MHTLNKNARLRYSCRDSCAGSICVELTRLLIIWPTLIARVRIDSRSSISSEIRYTYTPGVVAIDWPYVKRPYNSRLACLADTFLPGNEPGYNFYTGLLSRASCFAHSIPPYNLSFSRFSELVTTSNPGKKSRIPA